MTPEEAHKLKRHDRVSRAYDPERGEVNRITDNGFEVLWEDGKTGFYSLHTPPPALNYVGPWVPGDQWFRLQDSKTRPRPTKGRGHGRGRR